MASEITVALVSGGLVLATGLLTSRANWGFEKRRRREDRRLARIEQWRVEIRQLRHAETNHPAHNAEKKNNHLPEVPDPPEADSMQHEWFRTLKLDLSEDALNRVEELRQLRIHDRKGQIPDVLEQEVLRIERSEWELI
jgi:hypothetical protein